MLNWTLFFLLLAVVAGLFGFGGIASSAIGIAQILFTIFLLLFVVSFFFHLTRGRTPPI